MGLSKEEHVELYGALVERDGNICQGIARYAKFDPRYAQACKRQPLQGERFDIDELDGNHKHKCLENRQILCHPCNLLKQQLQARAKAFGQVYDNHTCVVCMCVIASAPATASMTNQTSTTADANNGISEGEKQESKHTRSRQQITSEFAWPRYRYWALLIYHLGYTIDHDILKDTISAEMGLKRGTIINNYFATLTASFSGLFHENSADRLASFERNPDIEVDEFESYLKDIIHQWERSGRKVEQFKQRLDMTPIRYLARLFKMNEKELLAKFVIRLEHAPRNELAGEAKP